MKFESDNNNYMGEQFQVAFVNCNLLVELN